MSLCRDCDSLRASIQAYAEEGVSEIQKWPRDHPTRETIQRSAEWDVAFAIAIFQEHARSCPIWHAEHQGVLNL